jgi:hypothetical protein
MTNNRQVASRSPLARQKEAATSTERVTDGKEKSDDDEYDRDT